MPRSIIRLATINGRKLALIMAAALVGLHSPSVLAGQTEAGIHLPAGVQELADSELDSIRAAGLYFRMDMSMEVFTPGDTTPQVVMNTTDPIVVPTASSGSASGSGTGGNITLAGNAQSGVSSLVNVIGSGSVINIGVNVINLSSSTNDTIYTTNTNVGLLGGSSSGTTPSIQLPVTLP